MAGPISSATTAPQLIDLHPAAVDLEALVVQGMERRPRQLPAWLLYDAEGSRLFEAICEQPEYSLTRTEVDLLESSGPAIHTAISAAIYSGQDQPPVVLEFGAGNARKASPLLQALRPPAYVALDISHSALEATCTTLQAAHPATQVLGVCCDYAAATGLPPLPALAGRRRLGFYPGSSIGNFEPGEARALLGQFRRLLGPGGLLLIGVDQPKTVERLEAAYNDRAGVSAAFARNLLVRLNRDLQGNFEPQAFRYQARWQAQESRIAMALVSRRTQQVHLARRRWQFQAGEALITEYSVKYSPAAFQELARSAGWQPLRRWSDPRNDLSLHLLAQADSN
jgi:dimethylhistidine N-methyltransferase